jgi:hypothetical protein
LGRALEEVGHGPWVWLAPAGHRGEALGELVRPCQELSLVGHRQHLFAVELQVFAPGPELHEVSVEGGEAPVLFVADPNEVGVSVVDDVGQGGRGDDLVVSPLVRRDDLVPDVPEEREHEVVGPNVLALPVELGPGEHRRT